MTEKLFESDSFLYFTKGRVVSCEKCENGFEIILDRTVFFPEGGGQPSDIGKISSVNVLKTYYKNEEIVHLCNAALKVGSEVDETVDAEHRFDNIQQHTGEHMLSYAFWHLFGAVNVGFHMNSEVATIDLDRQVTHEQVIKAEQFANRQIYENLPIKVYYTTLSQLKNKKVRKISDKGGEIPRVVEIEGGDICTCCGTHANFTGTVGIIKIIKSEKMRSGTRLEFLCGTRALKYFERQTETAHAVVEELSTDFGNAPDRIKEFKSRISDLNVNLKRKTEILSEYRAKEILNSAENGFALALEENINPKEARFLLNRLIKKCKAATVIFIDNSRVNYICACSEQGKYDCKFLCEILNGLFSGKGGGSNTFSQGGGNFASDWKERAEIFKKTIGRN